MERKTQSSFVFCLFKVIVSLFSAMVNHHVSPPFGEYVVFFVGPP